MKDFDNFADKVAPGEGVAADVSGEDVGGFYSDGDGTAVGRFSHYPAAVLGCEGASVDQLEVRGLKGNMISVFSCEQADGEEAATVYGGEAAVMMAHGRGGCRL